MKYKFKKGDKVTIKKGVDLGIIGISGSESVASLIGVVLTVGEDGYEGKWFELEEFKGKPTYAVDGWKIPQALLRKAK